MLFIQYKSIGYITALAFINAVHATELTTQTPERGRQSLLSPPLRQRIRSSSVGRKIHELKQDFHESRHQVISPPKPIKKGTRISHHNSFQIAAALEEVAKIASKGRPQNPSAYILPVSYVEEPIYTAADAAQESGFTDVRQIIRGNNIQRHLHSLPKDTTLEFFSTPLHQGLCRTPLIPAPKFGVYRPNNMNVQWPKSFVDVDKRLRLTTKVNKLLLDSHEKGETSSETQYRLRKEVYETVRAKASEQQANVLKERYATSDLLHRSNKFGEAQNRIAQVEEGLERFMKDFFTQAAEVAPYLSHEDIRRAQTNAWTMGAWQALDPKSWTAGQSNGESQKIINFRVTPSVLSFSLLYPLLDDFLDKPEVSSKDKKLFVQNFGNHIQYGSVRPPACNDYKIEPGANLSPAEIQNEIWRVFDMVETEWPRDRYPLAYRSMFELLVAQGASSIQMAGPLHGDRPKPSFEALWEITIRKGALSILANAYLSLGRATPDEINFAAHFGTMTQFLNDIRTMDEDFNEGQYTPWNHVWSDDSLVEHEKIERMDSILDVVLQHFARTFSWSANRSFVGGKLWKQIFLGVMLHHLTSKLIEGVAVYQERFSANMLQRVEAISSLKLDTVKELYELARRGGESGIVSD